MRKTFYKVALLLSNNQELNITIATSKGESALESIVERNKVYYTRPEYSVTGFRLFGLASGDYMSDAQYEEELIYTDVNDD
jgi:hypothetical protein